MSKVAFGRFQLDLERLVLLADGRPVRMRGRPLEILAFLVCNAGRVVPPEEIIAAVWAGVVVGENNLPVQMSILRRCLKVYGAEDLIVTMQNPRGYRFVGDVTCRETVDGRTAAAGPAVDLVDADADAADRVASHGPAPPVPDMAHAFWRRLALAGVAGACVLVVATTMVLANLSRTAVHLAARVQVETKPDVIVMVPGGYCRVDYVFRVEDPVALQLATEDMRFHLTSGEPVSRLSVRGRIYHGSFPIEGFSTGVYHNNIYLPPSVVTAARANDRNDVYLRHLFHLTDRHGEEVDVPAVLQIVFGSPDQACKAIK